MTTTSSAAMNHSILGAPSLKATASIKILLNDPELWKDLEGSERIAEEEEETTESDDDDDTEFRLSNCDLMDLPTMYRGYSKGGEELQEEAPPKSLASLLRSSPVGSPTGSSKMRRMASIRTFDSIAFEENQSSSNRKEIWKRDSTTGLGLHLSELEEQQHQPFRIFSKNICFLQELAKEATDNMEKTAKVLKEEPNANVLKAIVQSKFDCLGRNMGTLSSILRSRE